MPDAFSHIALPSLFHRWIGKPVILPLFLIGTVLPDYLRQGTALFLSSHFHPAVGIYHTALGAVLTSLLLSAFFHRAQRKWVFLSLLFGQFAHFAVDMLQGFLCNGKLYLLFPLRMSFEIGLISESYWHIIFIFSLLIFMGYWSIYLLRNRRQ